MQFANTPYAAALAKVKNYMIAMGKKGFRPEKLGEVVKTALTVSKPKARYTVTPDPLQHLMVNTLPKRVVDKIIARRAGLI